MTSDLSFFIPYHGRAKVSLCVPECFNLYVCPPSCVRRVSIRAPVSYTHLDVYKRQTIDWAQVFDQLGSMWTGEYGPWLMQTLY